MKGNQDNLKTAFSADWLLRGSLVRLGDILDRLTGRKGDTANSLATSQLIERLKRLLDSEVRQIAEKGKVVPHNITLKVQWDKFSTGEEDTDSLDRLQDELLAAAADHINDSLYYTFAPLELRVTPDYFIEGIKLSASFDKFGENDKDTEMNVTVPNIKINQEELEERQAASQNAMTLKAVIEPKTENKQKRLKVPGDGRVSIGRTGGNHLVIDDNSISKIHASLSIGSDGQISVADTGSTNGTFINGQRMSYGKAAKLGASDIVKLGSVEVSFEIETENAAPVPEEQSDDNITSIGEFVFTTKDISAAIDPDKSPTTAGAAAENQDSDAT